MQVKKRPYYLFVIVAALTFFVVAGTVFRRTQNLLKEHILNELTLSTKAVSGKVSAFLEGKKGRTLDFCSDGTIKDGLTFYDPDDPDVSALVKNTNNHLIKNKISLDQHLQDILILNLKGRVVFSTDERWLGKDKSKKDYFTAISRYFKDRAGLKKLQKDPTFMVYTSDIYLSDDFGAPVLAISNIVTARATGLPLGVLVNRYRGDCLNRFLKTEEEMIGKGAKVYIVNKEGLLLTVPKFLQSTEKEVMLKKGIEINRIIKAQSDSPLILGTYTDFRDVEVLGASMLMNENNWIILAEKDAQEVFLPLYQLTFQIAIIGVASLLTVIGVSFFIANLQRNIDTRTEQLEEARSQMYQAGKMAAVGQLASSIAHEVNNPLIGVLNNVQLIKMCLAEGGDFTSSECREILDRVEDSAQRCVKVSRSLLDFSRAGGGKFQPLSLNEVIKKTAALIENELRLRNVSLRLELEPNLPMVSGDFQLLSQAILDLVNNAQYAICQRQDKEAGVILLKTYNRMQADKVACVISDNGIGMPKENLEKLFVPFFTTKPQGQGTGLGLSIVHNIVTRHSGRIEAESQLDKGTSFTITLPVYSPNEKGAAYI